MRPMRLALQTYEPVRRLLCLKREKCLPFSVRSTLTGRVCVSPQTKQHHTMQHFSCRFLGLGLGPAYKSYQG